MLFLRHIIGVVASLLLSLLSAVAMPMAPTASDNAEFFLYHEVAVVESTSVQFTARVPPLTVTNVAFTGAAVAEHGNGVIMHGHVTHVASLDFGGGLDATNRVPIETSNGALVRPTDSPNYSVAAEVQMPSSAYPGVSRQRHNQISNQALHEAFEADPAYAARMESLYPGIVDDVRPGPRGAYPRSAPTPDVTWHHRDTPGQMQLVPRDQHTASGPVQDSLHPDGSGGYSIWGTE